MGHGLAWCERPARSAGSRSAARRPATLENASPYIAAGVGVAPTAAPGRGDPRAAATLGRRHPAAENDDAAPEGGGA
jgi:hypothetical protein